MSLCSNCGFIVKGNNYCPQCGQQIFSEKQNKVFLKDQLTLTTQDSIVEPEEYEASETVANELLNPKLYRNFLEKIRACYKNNLIDVVEADYLRIKYFQLKNNLKTRINNGDLSLFQALDNMGLTFDIVKQKNILSSTNSNNKIRTHKNSNPITTTSKPKEKESIIKKILTPFIQLFRFLLVRALAFIVVMFFIFFVFFIADKLDNKSNSNNTKVTKVKKKVKKTIKSDIIISNSIKWYDSKNYFYKTNLKISNNDYLKSINNRDNKFKTASSFGNLYSAIYNSDKLDLDLVYKELDFIRKDRSLSKKKFAEVVVAMVQHMPYSFVVEKPCSMISDLNYRNMIRQGTQCEDGVKAGLYTPLELVKKMKGDCDSRTLFIFTVLKKFNYDVVILNSDLYAHSIIGLNIPSQGKYKYYKGKRYYTWETTFKGWSLGNIPPECSDLKYWYVALT